MEMRVLALGLAVLALSACDSGTVPSPADRQYSEAAADLEFDENLIILRPDGLTAGPEAFYFAAGQSEVEAAVARVMGGKPEMIVANQCSGGPLESASFSGLSVHFRGGIFVGWSTRDDSEQVRVAGDVQFGSSRETAKAALGYSPIGETSIGEEFALGGEIGGAIVDDTVVVLYAGAQCISR